MALPTLTVASAVRALAQELIAAHHPHLHRADILYVFTDQKRKRCDRVRIGSAAKMNGLQRFLASGLDSVEDGPNFIVLIDENQWTVFGEDARRALVDHELCHCALFVNNTRPATWRRIQPGENPDNFPQQRWGLRGHDIEEFGEVLYRYGFWKPDEREQYVKAVALQLVLPRENGVVEHTQVTVPSPGRRRRGTRSSESE